MKNDAKIIAGTAVTLQVDGQPLAARRGQTVATALLAAGRRVLRHTRNAGKPRGLFCAMGVCFDCLVVVDGVGNRQGCLVRVAEGMAIETQRGKRELGR